MRHARRISLCFAIAATFLTGCLNLETVQYQPGTALPYGALPYALTKTSIMLTSTYQLTQCDKTKGIKFTTATSLATVPSADDDMRFYIDYKAMQSALKDTSVSLDLYSTGTIKDINATGTDQSLQSVVAGFGAALSGTVAIASGGLFHAEEKGPNGEDLSQPCTKAIQDALTALDTANTNQKNIQAKQKKDSAAVTNAKASGKTAPAAIKTLQGKVDADTTLLSAANDEVTKETAKLTLVTTQTITPLRSDFVTLTRWISESQNDSNCIKKKQVDPKADCSSNTADADAGYLKKITGLDAFTRDTFVYPAGGQTTIPYKLDFSPLKTHWFQAVGWDAFKSQPASKVSLGITIAKLLAVPPGGSIVPNSPENPIEGLPVSQAVDAHLHLCKIYSNGDTETNECVSPTYASVVTAQGTTMADISLPQLGSPAVLTLQGSPIQLSQLTVSMNQDGSISNITTKDSSTLTQIFNSLASSFTTVSTQENATIQAQATSLTAKNGTVTAQSSLLTAQNSTTKANAALLTAQNGTTTANASALTAQTAAAAAQAQANDQLLKAQADCLLQYKAVVQAGGVPVANCQ
jgi:hypothetical protein